MTVIIGEETEGATAITLSAEKGYLTKRKALKTGKVAKLAFKVPNTNKATKLRLGIFSSVAEKPAALLAETGIITVATETALTVEGTLSEEVNLTEGTEYFLGVLPLDNTSKVKATEKAGFGFKSSLAITELNKGVYTGVLNAFGEPLPIWGVEGEATTGHVVTVI